MFKRIKQSIVGWLMKETSPTGFPMSDFERMQFELRSCDVLLVEGRSRVSEIIKAITQSSWSHTALYIGRIHDIENNGLLSD